MAQDIELTDPAAIAAANAEVLKKQAAQDISGQTTAPGLNIPTGSALDKLRDAAIANKKAGVDELEGDPAAEKSAAVLEVTPKTADPAPPEPTEAEKLAKSKAEADAEIERHKVSTAEDLKKQADELFKEVPSLPPNASDNAKTSWAALKQKAAEQIRDLTKQVEDLSKAKVDLESKVKQPIPENVSKELEDLRQFRARLDIETDPKWKQFDEKVAQDNEFIYAQLKKASIPGTTIEEIKKFGGPVQVNMEKILAAVADPITKQVIASKLADIEVAGYQKDQAIQKAKQDTKKYLEDREKDWAESATAHNTATHKAIENIVSKVPWLNPVAVDLKADSAKQKEAEAHNEYATAMRKELELASGDDSAEMRATLLVGMVNLFRLQTAYDLLQKSSTGLEAKSKKEIADLTATIDRLKAAGTSRLRGNSVPAGEIKDPPKLTVHETAGQAMDRLRAEKIRASQASA